MSRNLSLYLADILNSIDKIHKYTTNLTYSDFCADDKTLDAVIHNLLIIGEATKQIPDSLRSKYSQIEWQKIAGIRDIIAHTYFYINPKIIWNIITTQLVLLQTTVKLILNNENL